MTNKSHTSFLRIAMVMFFAAITWQASAGMHPNPGEHAAYLDALANLRNARWLIQHQAANIHQTNDEAQAVKSIDAAISELQKNRIDDGKPLDFHPVIEEKDRRIDRLNAALVYLQKAEEQVNKEAEAPALKGLKAWEVQNISRAIASVKGAIRVGNESFAK